MTNELKPCPECSGTEIELYEAAHYFDAMLGLNDLHICTDCGYTVEEPPSLTTNQDWNWNQRAQMKDEQK